MRPEDVAQIESLQRELDTLKELADERLRRAERAEGIVSELEAALQQVDYAYPGTDYERGLSEGIRIGHEQAMAAGGCKEE